MATTAAPIHGKYAKITDSDGNAAGYSTDATLNISNTIADASRQGQDWEEKSAGQNKWSGSMNFLYITGDLEQKALHDNIIVATAPSGAYEVRFYPSSGQYYSGSIVITGVSIAANKGGMVTFNVTFEGTGALTYN